VTLDDSLIEALRRDYRSAPITEQERVNFKTVAEAKDQGYVACPVCEPWEVGFAP